MINLIINLKKCVFYNNIKLLLKDCVILFYKIYFIYIGCNNIFNFIFSSTLKHLKILFLNILLIKKLMYQIILIIK